MSAQTETARPPHQPVHRLQPPPARVHADLSNRIQAINTSAPIYRNGYPNLHAVWCSSAGPTSPIGGAVPVRGLESLSGCIPRSLLRASGLLPCCPNTPQLAAGIFYLNRARQPAPVT